MAEPSALVLLGAGLALALERLFRWLGHQEQESAYWERQKALEAYRGRHRDQLRPRCPA